MREYARVCPSFWTGKTGKQIKNLGHECQVMALYLLTSPHSNMIGLYYLPLPFMSHETGSPIEGACEALRSLEMIGFAYYDTESEFIWVPEMARFQIGGKLKPNDKQVKGILNSYKALPNNPFLYAFFEMYKDDFHLTEPRGNPSDTPLKPKPLTSPSQAPSKQGEGEGKEKDKEKEYTPIDPQDLNPPHYLTKKGRKLRGDRLRDFERFWAAFNYKTGKAAAADSWYDLKNYSAKMVEQIISGAEKEAMARPEKIKRGITPKMAQGWLTERRWEDECVTPEQTENARRNIRVVCAGDRSILEND